MSGGVANPKNDHHSLYEELSQERQEIRLLIVQQDSASTNFQCLLAPRPLDQVENRFTALSYTWGDPADTMSLNVNGQICQVTRNLYLALSYLIIPYPFLVIWVDALCINQDDPVEKASQIGIMGDIYRKAEHVLVWLGESDETSHLGMKALEQIGEAYHGAGRDTKKAFDSIEDFPGEPALASIANLLKRPWWSRAWTLQEITLGKGATLVCGADTLLWDWVYFTKEAFLDFDGLRNSKLFPVLQKYTMVFEDMLIEGKMILWNDGRRRNVTEKRDLLYVVAICRPYFATNPLDKIYSGMALAAPLSGLDIDLQITPRELYIKFATAHINNNQSLEILRHAGIGCSQVDPDDPVPSWVPDFRYRRPSSPIPLAKGTHPAIQTSAEFSDRKIIIRGILVDEVTSSTPFQTSHPNPWVKTALEEHPLTYRNSSLPYIQAFFRTLFMNYNYKTDEFFTLTHKSFFAPAVIFSVLTADMDEEYIPEYIKTFAENEGYPLHQALLIHMFEQGNPVVAAAYKEFEADVAAGTEKSHLSFVNYTTRHRVLGFDRCFVKTKDGFMGLTPKGTKEGDLVCVVKGCDVPLVLRKVEGKEEFVLLGDCFTFGLMPRLIFADGLLEERVRPITLI